MVAGLNAPGPYTRTVPPTANAGPLRSTSWYSAVTVVNSVEYPGRVKVRCSGIPGGAAAGGVLCRCGVSTSATPATAAITAATAPHTANIGRSCGLVGRDRTVR